MKRQVLAITAIAAFAALPALAEAPRSVPIYMSDTGHIMADAMVNGSGPFPFVIDTAAGGTVAFQAFADDAGLEEVVTDEPIYVQGASGVTEAQLVEVGDMQMGEWSFYAGQAVVLPSPADMNRAHVGVLGMQHLLVQPLGFELAEGEIQIYEPDVAIDANDLTGDWFSVAYQPRMGGFVWTHVTIDGVEMEAVIDTGARRTTINPAAARALGVNPDGTGLEADEPVRGASNHSQEAWIVPVTTVQLGERVWGSRHVTVSDLSIFHALGRTDEPTVVFGVDYLAEQNFIIDPVANLIWMQKRQSAALGYLARRVAEFSSENR